MTEVPHRHVHRDPATRETPVVARAPGGEVATTLWWSLTPAELDYQLVVIKNKVLVSSGVMRGAPTEDEQPVRELGQRLFEALIADDVRALYVASRQRESMAFEGLVGYAIHGRQRLGEHRHIESRIRFPC